MLIFLKYTLNHLSDISKLIAIGNSLKYNMNMKNKINLKNDDSLLGFKKYQLGDRNEFTIRQLAKILNLSEQSFYSICNKNKIDSKLDKAIPIEKLILFNKLIEDWRDRGFEPKNPNNRGIKKFNKHNKNTWKSVPNKEKVYTTTTRKSIWTV